MKNRRKRTILSLITCMTTLLMIVIIAILACKYTIIDLIANMFIGCLAALHFGYLLTKFDKWLEKKLNLLED